MPEPWTSGDSLSLPTRGAMLAGWTWWVGSVRRRSSWPLSTPWPPVKAWCWCCGVRRASARPGSCRPWSRTPGHVGSRFSPAAPPSSRVTSRSPCSARRCPSCSPSTRRIPKRGGSCSVGWPRRCPASARGCWCWTTCTGSIRSLRSCWSRWCDDRRRVRCCWSWRVRPGAVAETVLGRCALRGPAGDGARRRAPGPRRPPTCWSAPAGQQRSGQQIFESSGGNPLLLVELATRGDHRRAEQHRRCGLPRCRGSGGAQPLPWCAPGPCSATPSTTTSLLPRPSCTPVAGHDAVDELHRGADLVHAGSAKQLTFRHPVIRSAVYESQPVVVRLRNHARAAAVLGVARGVAAEPGPTPRTRRRTG